MVSLEGWGQSPALELGTLLRITWQGSRQIPRNLQGRVDPCLLPPSGPWTLRAETAACPTTSMAAEKGFTRSSTLGIPDLGRAGGQL